MSIVGIAGHKQSGKNTVALIWQLLLFEASHRYKEIVGTRYANDIDFVSACIKGEEDFRPYEYSFSWQQKAFAHKLKQIVCILTGCTMKQLEGEEFKNSKLPYTWTKSSKIITTYRELLQQLGTDIFRDNIHPDLWVDLLMEDYDKAVLERAPENWLITDVRFVNEAEAINARGGTLIRVSRGIKSEDNHRSETGLKDSSQVFYNIYNDGTLEELIIQVKNIMRMEGLL